LENIHGNQNLSPVKQSHFSSTPNQSKSKFSGISLAPTASSDKSFKSCFAKITDGSKLRKEKSKVRFNYVYIYNYEKPDPEDEEY
jgi:hypothetical protein